MHSRSLCQLRAFMIKPLQLLLLLMLLHGNKAPLRKKNIVKLRHTSQKIYLCRKRALNLSLHRMNEKKEREILKVGGKINYRLAHLSHTLSLCMHSLHSISVLLLFFFFTPLKAFCCFFWKMSFLSAIHGVYIQNKIWALCWVAGWCLLLAKMNFLHEWDTFHGKLNIFSLMLVLHFYSFDVEHEN